jgi:hypothetical protein
MTWTVPPDLDPQNASVLGKEYVDDVARSQGYTQKGAALEGKSCPGPALGQTLEHMIWSQAEPHFGL